jgi:serine/threonine protein kinase
LKPENIMLTDINERGNRVAKLVDFGESRETSQGVGSTFSKKGTPQWWSPEQIQNKGGCSTASDVFAVGLVARFLWNARMPSPGGEAGAHEQWHQVLTNEQTTHQHASLMHSCLIAVRLQPELQMS